MMLAQMSRGAMGVHPLPLVHSLGMGLGSVLEFTIIGSFLKQSHISSFIYESFIVLFRHKYLLVIKSN